MSKLNDYFFAMDKAEALDIGHRAAVDRFNDAAREAAETVAARLRQADLGRGDFTVYELVYAAQFRCLCGAGMAYPEDIGMHGAWYCSAILLGQAKPGTEHTPSHPFVFYEIKSEGQPSGGGATTRPAGTHVEVEPIYACHNCGNAARLERYPLGQHREMLKDIVCANCGEQYLNADGSSNSKLRTRYFHIVIADKEETQDDERRESL